MADNMTGAIEALRSMYAAGRTGPAWQRTALEVIERLEKAIEQIQAEKQAAVLAEIRANSLAEMANESAGLLRAEIASLKAEKSALQADVARLRRDGEMLDWLADRMYYGGGPLTRLIHKVSMGGSIRDVIQSLMGKGLSMREMTDIGRSRIR